jgi:hypothetical protein
MSFILGCKESCFESAECGCFLSIDLVCFTVFILMIELEQDIKINIRNEYIGYIFNKCSHRMVRIKLVSISVIRVLAVFLNQITHLSN